MASLTRTLYRAFLREARALRAAPAPLLLHAPLAPEAAAKRFGRGAYAPPPAPGAALAERFPGVPFDELGLTSRAELVGDDVVRAVRRLFRARGAPGLDAALAHLAAFNELRASAPCFSRTTTRRDGGISIVVELTTVFLPHLPPDVCLAASHWPFAYRVRVINDGAVAAQVLGRHWLITDTRGGAIEVPRGSPGVVGHTPVIEPGAAFEYCSGVQLHTPTGEIAGSLRMVADSRPFDAIIAPTVLTARVKT